MTINQKCQQLPILRTQSVEWGGLERNYTNKLIFPYPKYGDDVREWITKMNELQLMDYDYSENYRVMDLKAKQEGTTVQEKDVTTFTRDEILTLMTYFIRCERFCDGLIADNLKNGRLEAMCMHLHNITADL